MIILFDRASAPLIGRILRDHLKPHLGRVAIAMFYMAVSAGMTALFAKLVEPVLDRVLIKNEATFVWPLALGVMMCFVLRGITTYAHTIIMGRVGQNIVADIQSRLFSTLMRQDLAFFHEHHSGDLLSRLTNDVAVMRGAVAEGLTSAGKSTLTLILLVCIMVYQDWQLSIFALTIFPLTMLFVAKVGKRLRKISFGTQEATATFASRLTQTFQGIRQVKSYTAENFEINKLSGRISEMTDLAIKNVRVGNLSTPVNDILVGVIVVGLILYAAGGGHGGPVRLSPGELMSFITAFLMAYEPMKRIAKTNNAIQTGLGAAQRVFAILDMHASIVDKSNAARLDITTPSIDLNNVVFSYANADHPALDGVTLHVPAGKTYALVGASGSGKSTCFNLILRLYDVAFGSITIGGQDVRDVTQQSLRAAIGLVSQEVVVFDDTAAANIAYGAPADVSMEAIITAAKAAHAHDFIMALPDGYNTRLGENGVTLSGGQRQRITLARAFLKNAPILLLDEATSALDSESERLVQQSLDRLMQGRTTLVIAHRLSTIQDADEIVVFERGRIVEQGTHEFLLAKNGAYARLHHRYGQMEQANDAAA